MKYVVKTICNEILKDINNAEEESLFLINGFEDLDIYTNVCKNLTQFAIEKGKSITIKLAKNKWNYFKKKYRGQPQIHVMEQNDWVLTNESTTEYRNKHNSDILVLLGTESEDDLSGSLKEISQINCGSLVDLLPTFDKHTDYSDMFSYNGMHLSDDERKVINKLYGNLFEFVNKDICKLSDFIDKNNFSELDITGFIEVFFKTLPDWGLPTKKLNLPSYNQLLKQLKNNILRPEYNFINGITFKNISSSAKKYEKKLDQYEEDKEEFSSIWEGWSSQPLHSYQEFSDCIKDFIRGKRNKTIKNKLLNLDFSIVESVLGLKIQTEKKARKTTIKVFGNPLVAFNTSYLFALNQMKSSNKVDYIDEVKFDFNYAEIVSETSSDEDEDYKKCWKNICIHTKGALEQIESYNYKLNGNEIVLDYNPKDIFDISVEPNSMIVHAASPNKKAHKVQYFITGFNSGKQVMKTEFEWIFEPNDEWLYDFYDISINDFSYEPKNPIIPLTTLSQITNLILKKSEEEFFDYLGLKCNFDFSCNLLKDGAHQDIFVKHPLYKDFENLGSKFASFCNTVVSEGMYYALSNESGKANELINAYYKLGTKILKERFNENEYFILDLFIHAFNIEQNDKSITNDKDIECCIVPPWHPASVEKIKHRNQFFTDGCWTLWDQVESQSGYKGISATEIKNTINELLELSVFQNSVDVFPMNNTAYFGSTTSYGKYSLYAKQDLKAEDSLRDLIKKEFVFDDEFKNNIYSNMSEDSYMIYDVLHSYINAFPNSKDKLSLVFIDPSDLQPIVSSVDKYIRQFQSTYGEDAELSINLSILVRPENKGGKNYITYWMNESFDLDSNIKIKTYLNEWEEIEDLEKFINGNNDIVFVMDLLKINDYEFIDKLGYYKPSLSECYYPIVLRPSPISNTTTKRRIELTQPQFKASTIHTQTVRYRKNMDNQTDGEFYAVKTVDIDENVQDLIYRLHDNAYWVVCVDQSMDGKLLRETANDKGYSVIGFSTGKGRFGQYNLTITARNSILKSIENNFSSRLHKMFKWDEEVVRRAAKICMNEASQLDGISVLTASNQKDYNINEFMAYVLTSLRDRESQDDCPLKIIVHLDSYKHWFDKNSDIKNIFDDKFSASRPDFLLLKIRKNFEEKLMIDATVIECKTALLEHKDFHLEKAEKQVKHGIDILKNKFNPRSRDLKRRYWYAQLYRALTFAQISFNNSSAEFSKLSEKLRGILNGDFEIEWSGEILGYWLNMPGESEIEEKLNGDIILHNIPQLRVQKLILGNDEAVTYSDIDESLLKGKEEYYELEKKQEEEIDEMINASKIDAIKKYEETYNIANVENNKEDNLEVDENPEKVESEINTEETEVVVEEVEKEMEVEIEKDSNESSIILPANKSENIEDIRVLVGEDRYKNKVYWEFGNKLLANRHLLITGTSGQGKTYSIQTMLFELSKSNVSSIIFDYTEGFRLDQLESKFVESMDDKLYQRIVKQQGVPINPFKQHEIEVCGTRMLETPADVAGRFANILSHVYGFGDQQSSAIFTATRIGLEKYGKNMDMSYFEKELENTIGTNKAARTVLSKMQPFFYSVQFSKEEEEFDWGKILYSDQSQTTIFQLTMIDREMQVIITELMLWDAWYYTKKHGSKDKPFVVVLDEAQNLSHKSNSPSAAILTEGRKFGWSAWFATQSLKILSDDEIVRLLQSAFKLYFKPTDEEILKMAKQLDPADSSAWLTPFKNLKKGQCIVVGDRVRLDGVFGATRPTVTSVTSFEKRENHES